jgi:hypothetical protein
MSLTSCSTDYKSFQHWQADYAAHGIATFPVGPDKKPLVSHYGRFGLRGSAEIARKFPDATGFGFMAGPRNHITALDIDTPSETVLADALNRYGQTAIIVRSGSGNHHAWYRYNGERRHIKAESQIDILGGGLVVAPPSQMAKGGYQFIQGRLDDLDRLPVMVPPSGAIEGPNGLVGKKDGDGRNAELFKILGRAAHRVDDFEQLLDYARTQNEFCDEPMADAEVAKIVANVWRMQCEGRNRFGTFGAWVPLELSRKLARYPDAYALYGVLNAENGPDSIFPIANAMADTAINFGWRRLAQARKVIIGLGLVEQVNPDTRHKPALYRWPNRVFPK